MKRSTWLPVLAFLAVLAGLFFVGRVARGDEFLDRVKALEARNAAAKPADPFAGGNAAKGRHGVYEVYELAYRTGGPFWVVSARDYPLAGDSKHYATREEAQAEADRLNAAAKPDPFGHGNHAAKKDGPKYGVSWGEVWDEQRQAAVGWYWYVTDGPYGHPYDGKRYSREELAQAEAERLNGVAKPADPFGHDNHAGGQPCGCAYCTCNEGSNCGSPLCPKLNRAGKLSNCGCSGNQCGHACDTDCTDATCPWTLKTGPRLGNQKVTDDPARPWTYDYGDRYGYGHELGWYRFAATPPVTYYAPVSAADSSPGYHRLAPTYYQAAPRFFGGGGGGNCGPSG
jgi:hypothetical protein